MIVGAIAVAAIVILTVYGARVGAMHQRNANVINNVASSSLN